MQELTFSHLRLDEQPETADTTPTGQGIELPLFLRALVPAEALLESIMNGKGRKKHLVVLINY